jgi:hypothetical protein
VAEEHELRASCWARWAQLDEVGWARVGRPYSLGAEAGLAHDSSVGGGSACLPASEVGHAATSAAVEA